MATDREKADQSLFDHIASEYVRKDLTGYCRVARKQRLTATLRGMPCPIENFLEVGCGGGFTAQYLRGQYRKYTGIDYSQNLIAYAQRHNASENAQFICANVKEFVSEDAYQVIMMIGVLHHIEYPTQVLDLMRDLLEEGGVLVVNEPQRGNPVISLLRKIRKQVDPQYSTDQVEFSEQELRELFTKSGYSVNIFPQGLLSTPFAESQLLPGIIGGPLTRLAVWFDRLFEPLFRVSGLRRLAWNVVVQATPSRKEGVAAG